MWSKTSSQDLGCYVRALRGIIPESHQTESFSAHIMREIDLCLFQLSVSKYVPYMIEGSL